MSASAPAPSLAPELRGRLAAVADVIFPTTAAMPSASAVGVATRLVDRALRADPRLAGPLAQALAATPGLDADTELIALRDADPAGFRALVLVVAAAYYLSPEVWRAIGYGGQTAHPIDVRELPAYLEDGTLDRVVARGPLYRDVAERRGAAAEGA